MAYEMFTVLLVDDNQVTLMLYEKFLAAHHYRVVKAKDGAEALQKAFAERPDVILLDIMMPGLNGYEVCARLREAPSTADIPIIMLTALDRASARQKALEIGADDFIIKTEGMESVDGRIMMMLKKRIQTHTHSWLADLPGSAMLDYALRSHMEAGKRLGVVFLDVKDMEAFNKSAGFEEGERILWQVAAILNEVTQERAKGEFVGYLGQEHFMILCDPSAARVLVETIVKNFEIKIQSELNYPSNRNEYPSLAVAAVLVEKGKSVHPGQVYYAGQMLLRKARSQPGNSIQGFQFK